MRRKSKWFLMYILGGVLLVWVAIYDLRLNWDLITSMLKGI